MMSRKTVDHPRLSELTSCTTRREEYEGRDEKGGR
jgi:hypothetical protein